MKALSAMKISRIESWSRKISPMFALPLYGIIILGIFIVYALLVPFGKWERDWTMKSSVVFKWKPNRLNKFTISGWLGEIYDRI
jgi:hypothetical protein